MVMTTRSKRKRTMSLVMTRETEKPTAADQDRRWQAVVERDPAFDGKFVYAVKTTGVYCRPTCPARLAKPANVTFHATGKEAEAAGFRACLRCRPNEAATADRHIAAVAGAVRQLESADELPTLAVLARAAGMSPFHFH